MYIMENFLHMACKKGQFVVVEMSMTNVNSGFNWHAE